MGFWHSVFSKRDRSAGGSERAFRVLAENTADAIFRFGADLKVKYISPSVANLYGRSPEEIVALGGTAASNKLIHPDDAPTVAAAIGRHLSGEVTELKLDFRILHKDGSAVWVETNCRSLVDQAGKVTDLILTMRDISEKKDLQLKLAELASTDSLTGLANRRIFDETLEREWARTLRTKGCMSLLIIDIDHFKKFNDHFGHQVGDDCLRGVARSLSSAVPRAIDLVARYGGEEFAVILPDTDQAGAMHVAQRVRMEVAALSIPVPTGETSEHLTVSIGVATTIALAGGTTRMPEGLLQAADRALYGAKAAGRNRVETALLLSPVQPN